MVLLLGLFLFLVVVNCPIAFSLGITCLVYMLSTKQVLLMLPQRMVAGVDNFVLLAVPFFILAGILMNTGGVTRRLFQFAKCLIGHIPGGLGHANVVASMIFAGMSGAAVADAGGLGMIEIEAMTKDGYDADFSAAITAASSTIGPIIPPSVPMVIYAMIANVSVGGLFLGGFIPGVLMGLFLMIQVYLVARKREDYPKYPRATAKELFLAFKEALLPLFTPVIILGGIFSGVFTPTEASVVAATYALILGVLVYREIKVSDLLRIFLDVVSTLTVLTIIVAAASIYGWLLAREQVPQAAANFLLSISTNPVIVLLVVNIFLLIVGCFMETVAALTILTPILVPLATSIGIDPLHFGVVMVLNLMIGLCTPPVGMCLYIVAKIADISFERVVKTTLPYLIPLIVVLFMISYIPSLVMFLPNLIFGAPK